MAIPQPTEIVDIVPEVEVVHGITVRGLSFRMVTELLRRYPELWIMLSGSVPQDIDGGMLTAIILAASRRSGDVDLESALDDMPFHEQMDFVAPLVRLTVGKNGIGPFIQTLAVAFGVSAENGPETEKKIPSRKFHRPQSGSSTSAAEPSEKSLQ